MDEVTCRVKSRSEFGLWVGAEQLGAEKYEYANGLEKPGAKLCLNYKVGAV
jgi:hypothetical protein